VIARAIDATPRADPGPRLLMSPRGLPLTSSGPAVLAKAGRGLLCGGSRAWTTGVIAGRNLEEVSVGDTCFRRRARRHGADRRLRAAAPASWARRPPRPRRASPTACSNTRIRQAALWEGGDPEVCWRATPRQGRGLRREQAEKLTQEAPARPVGGASGQEMTDFGGHFFRPV